jgi:C4-dicarboxylate-specific signal transduction histidine kinase
LVTLITKGIGLGLAISRDPPRAMNGDQTVESDEGQRAKFTVALKAVQNTPCHPERASAGCP